jgi:hypothetical protein
LPRISDSYSKSRDCLRALLLADTVKRDLDTNHLECPLEPLRLA